jgi:hypothetical protein
MGDARGERQDVHDDHPWRGKPIFHEGVTEVSITDEAAGEFVRIKQFRTDRTAAIEVDVSEWPVVSQVIEWMLEQCRLGNDG